jgi:hypothetical protein
LRRNVRIAGIALVAAAGGVGAAVAAGAAGGDGVRACAVNSSGQIVAQSSRGCARGELAITISGDAFKRSKNGTLTINGVAFKRGTGGTITINGTAFKRSGRTLTINGTTFKSSGRTLTINGTAFKRSGRDTITINGTAFKSSGRTLTINGVALPAGSGGTLTINGTPVTAGATGPIGPAGPAGPPGASAVRAGRPAEADGPIPATLGAAAADLISAPFTNGDGTPHRVLLAGGFDADCAAPCPSPAQGIFDVRRDGVAAFTRRLPQFQAAGITNTSGVFSEVVDTPAVCAPCTFTLRLQAAGAIGGGGASTINATAIRLAVVDLGPAG